jgi:hypothetical protein
MSVMHELCAAASTTNRLPRYWPLIAGVVLVVFVNLGQMLSLYVGPHTEEWRRFHRGHHHSICLHTLCIRVN